MLTTDFIEANGYLTPSMKVKRAEVLADFAGRSTSSTRHRAPAVRNTTDRGAAVEPRVARGYPVRPCPLWLSPPAAGSGT